MDAGYELPLPAAQIVDRLNVRPRIPLSPWSLHVTSVALIARPGRLPLIELTVEATQKETAQKPDHESTSERWLVRFPAEQYSVEPGAQAQPFLLWLKVRLEEWWLNRGHHSTTKAQRSATEAQRLDET